MRTTHRSLARILGLIAIISMISALTLTTASAAPERARESEAEHIILVIGDGMQLEHEIATSRYLTGKDYKLAFHRLPYQGNVASWDVTTYDNYGGTSGALPFDPGAVHPEVGYDPAIGGHEPFPMDSGVDDYFLYIPDDGYKPFATDSASAATAYATGYKTDDGNIAWLPGDVADGDLQTIAELLRDEKGYAIGVVSTVPYTHATPAAFTSHNVYRSNYGEIAREMLTEVQPDVVIGAGHPGCWDEGCESGYIPADLYWNMKTDTTDDYVFVERIDGQDGGRALRAAAREARATDMKLFGLFGGPGGNFESPIPLDQPGNPAVVQAATEDPLLADAALAALHVVAADEDGFFLLIEQGDIDWANHGNDYARMVGTTWDLHKAVRSIISYVDRQGDDMHWGNTLLVVTSDHGTSYMRLTGDPDLGKGDLPLQVPPEGEQVCGAYKTPFCEYPDGEVTYGVGEHTNELVRLYARGATASLFTGHEGTWYPCTSIIDNTQVYLTMAAAAGLPQASPYTVIPGACAP
ncbi:MAG TPA: alkaline phosphatase [Acidimicrobiia bacterium]|nr:alkaline phosphatase [Acidimicrobiia bacterium]